jgi:fumarylacetoacetase
MIKANDPTITSWVKIEENSDFPIQNLPFGIIRKRNNECMVAVAIGGYVLDMAELNALGFLNELSLAENVFKTNYLNTYLSLGKTVWTRVRNRVSELLRSDSQELQNNQEAIDKVLILSSDVEMQLPIQVGDYTDFYSSIEHATNVGTMFRDPNNALLPNWRHLPVGYHGRSSSIILSGENIHRPKGQIKADDTENPSFGPTRLLDFELEMAFITGNGNSITIENAEDHIFGLVLFNDWSARDIQKWEYVPLGPFLAKSFASSISPWVVTLDALEPFRVEGPIQDPEVLPYLKYEGKKNYDINLEVIIQPENGDENTVCKSNFKYMYWNMCQQLAHQTVNGCNVNPGDMYGSGTISGPEPDSYGSMLELAWKGTKPITLSNGTERKFINDGDTVTMKGYCNKNGSKIGFGKVSTKVLPTK